MAIAWVQDNNGTSSVTSSTIISATLNSVGNGNIIVGVFIGDKPDGQDLGMTISTCTDSSGDTPTVRGTMQYSSAIKYYVQSFTVVNASNTGTHTLTVTTSNTAGGFNGRNVYLLEYSGSDAAPFDVAAGATGTNTTPTLSFTTAVANEFLVCAGAMDSNLTGGTGVTIQISDTSTWYQRGGDKLAVSSGANSFAMSGAASNGWAMAGVAIKPFGGAGTTPITVTDLPIDSLAGGEIV